MNNYNFKLFNSGRCDKDCQKTYFDILSNSKKTQIDFFNIQEIERKNIITKLISTEYDKNLYDDEIYKKLFKKKNGSNY